MLRVNYRRVNDYWLQGWVGRLLWLGHHRLLRHGHCWMLRQPRVLWRWHSWMRLRLGHNLMWQWLRYVWLRLALLWIGLDWLRLNGRRDADERIELADEHREQRFEISGVLRR